MRQIRKATNSDIEQLFYFQMAMARESEEIFLDPDKLRSGLSAVLAKPELGTYYVEQNGEELTGCLLVTREWSDWRNSQIWWIQSVYVSPHQRRTGVYRRLYQYLKDLASSDQGAAGIRLYVGKENTKAREVYRNLGMSEDRYLVYEWLKTDH